MKYPTRYWSRRALVAMPSLLLIVGCLGEAADYVQVQCSRVFDKSCSCTAARVSKGSVYRGTSNEIAVSDCAPPDTGGMCDVSDDSCVCNAATCVSTSGNCACGYTNVNTSSSSPTYFVDSCSPTSNEKCCARADGMCVCSESGCSGKVVAACTPDLVVAVPATSTSSSSYSTSSGCYGDYQGQVCPYATVHKGQAIATCAAYDGTTASASNKPVYSPQVSCALTSGNGASTAYCTCDSTSTPPSDDAVATAPTVTGSSCGTQNPTSVVSTASTAASNLCCADSTYPSSGSCECFFTAQWYCTYDTSCYCAYFTDANAAKAIAKIPESTYCREHIAGGSFNYCCADDTSCTCYRDSGSCPSSSIAVNDCTTPKAAREPDYPTACPAGKTAYGACSVGR